MLEPPFSRLRILAATDAVRSEQSTRPLRVSRNFETFVTISNGSIKSRVKFTHKPIMSEELLSCVESHTVSVSSAEISAGVKYRFIWGYFPAGGVLTASFKLNCRL